MSGSWSSGARGFNLWAHETRQQQPLRCRACMSSCMLPHGVHGDDRLPEISQPCFKTMRGGILGVAGLSHAHVGLQLGHKVLVALLQAGLRPICTRSILCELMQRCTAAETRPAWPCRGAQRRESAGPTAEAVPGACAPVRVLKLS